MSVDREQLKGALRGGFYVMRIAALGALAGTFIGWAASNFGYCGFVVSALSSAFIAGACTHYAIYKKAG